MFLHAVTAGDVGRAELVYLAVLFKYKYDIARLKFVAHFFFLVSYPKVG